jgi:hypothetical protein
MPQRPQHRLISRDGRRAIRHGIRDARQPAICRIMRAMDVRPTPTDDELAAIIASIVAPAPAVPTAAPADRPAWRAAARAGSGDRAVAPRWGLAERRRRGRAPGGAG